MGRRLPARFLLPKGNIISTAATFAPSQRSMIAARVCGIYDEQAKERKTEAGGDKKSDKAHSQSVVEKLPQPISGKSRDLAGKAVGVSGKMAPMPTRPRPSRQRCCIRMGRS